MKKILSAVMVSFAALTTFSFAAVSSVHASGYVSGVPTLLKNKTWQSRYQTHYLKGSNTPMKGRVTFTFADNKVLSVSDAIYKGKDSSEKESGSNPKYKQLGNDEYNVKTHEKGIGNLTYSIKLISKNHIKIKVVNYSGYQSYYAK